MSVLSNHPVISLQSGTVSVASSTAMHSVRMAFTRATIALLELHHPALTVQPLMVRDACQTPLHNAVKVLFLVRMDHALPPRLLNVPPTRTSKMATVFTDFQFAQQARDMPMDAVRAPSRHSVRKTSFGRMDGVPALSRSTVSLDSPSRMANVSLWLSPTVVISSSMGRNASMASQSAPKVAIWMESAALLFTSHNAPKVSSLTGKSAVPTRLPSVHLDPFSTRSARIAFLLGSPSARQTRDSMASTVPSSPGSAWSSNTAPLNRTERDVDVLSLELFVIALHPRINRVSQATIQAPGKSTHSMDPEARVTQAGINSKTMGESMVAIGMSGQHRAIRAGPSSRTWGPAMVVVTGTNDGPLGLTSKTMAVTGMSSQHLDLALRVARVGPSGQWVAEENLQASNPGHDIPCPTTIIAADGTLFTLQPVALLPAEFGFIL